MSTNFSISLKKLRMQLLLKNLTQSQKWIRRITTENALHSYSHPPTANLEFPVSLAFMSLDCGRKPKYFDKTHADADSTQGPGIKQAASLAVS